MIAAILCIPFDSSLLHDGLKGRVINKTNTPVPDCIISNHWVFYPDRPVCRTSRRNAITDSSGRFELHLRDHSASRCFLMLNLQQEKGRLLILDTIGSRDSLEIVLSDLVAIQGRIETPLKKPIDHGDISIIVGVRNQGVIGHAHPDSRGQFSLLLPPGEYLFGGEGEQFLSFVRFLVVRPGANSVELEPIKLEPTAMGELFGNRAPDWKITSAIPPAFGAKPSDLRGKWILIDFWPAPSFLTGPLTLGYSGRLRSLIEFESEYHDRGDEFAIIVFYLADLKGFSDSSNDAKRSISDTWPTPRLPFVCALDQTLETAKAWGIDRNHMSVLLAPDGRVHPCSSHLTLIELRRQLTSSSPMDGEQ